MNNLENAIYGQTLCRITIGEKVINARQIILPLPPSENDRLEVDFGAVKSFLGSYYSRSQRHKRKGLMKNSTNYNRWLQAATTLLKKGKLPQMLGPVCVLLTVVFPDNRVRDAQNREKPTFDCMQYSECLIENDVNVTFHCTDRRVIKGKAFILAYVFPRDALENNPFIVNEDYLQSIAEKIPGDYSRSQKT